MLYDFIEKAYSSFPFDTGASSQLFLGENDPIKNYLKELQQDLETEEKRQKNLMQQNAAESMEDNHQNNHIIEDTPVLFIPSLKNPSPSLLTLQLPSKEKLLNDMNLMPFHQAAILYKCNKEDLTQHCRTLGIKRWNYRKRKSQQNSIQQGFYEFEVQRR